ncbi:MAG: quinone oxidoreductase family protein [bacterium]
MKAIRIHQHGGPEVLKLEELPVPAPGPEEVLVRLHAVGVNFVEIYHRLGLYKVTLPCTLGTEAAGVVEKIGANVTEVKPGDRVAYALVLGAYAEYAIVPAQKLVPLPENIALQQAGAVMVQGMTAHYLTHSTYPLKAGETCVVHAAAGGVGLLIIQMAKRMGARVIGTVSTEVKAEFARAAGADAIILYTRQDFEREVKNLTNNRGVDVVYDSVGKTTYEKSMNCLRPRGFLVLFGQASGAVPPIDPLVLSAKGSIYLTRATLANYTATRTELLERAHEVFNGIAMGALRVRIDRTLPLAEAAQAHRLLENRQTAGKIMLQP